MVRNRHAKNPLGTSNIVKAKAIANPLKIRDFGVIAEARTIPVILIGPRPDVR
jgi:hypothetical protein